MQNALNSPKKINTAFALFIIVLVVQLIFITIGFQHTISDLHEFRQTQTALTSYYFIHEGYSLNYITPVLGPPWTIPFEFPIYQFFASALCQISGLPLEISGRLISLLFLYLSMWVSFIIMRALNLSKTQAYIVLCFVLINPILLFWGRTFMIESTALFFSLLFMLYVIKTIKAYPENNRKFLKYMLLAILLGVLGGLTKITTFIVFFMAAGLFLLDALVQLKRIGSKQWLKLGLYGAVIFIVPIITTYLWTHHADAQKSLSYLGDKITSASLSSFNYGTLPQRLSPGTWLLITRHGAFGYPLVIIMVATSYIFKLQYRHYIMLLAIPYFLTPLIFTNLYFVHNYYSFGNTILFSFCSALFTLSILSVRTVFLKFAMVSVSACAVVASLHLYFMHYYPYQNKNFTNMQQMGIQINHATRANDILLVTGIDWSSVVSYYSQRKSICLAGMWLKVDHTNQYQKADSILSKIKGDVTKFVVVADSLNEFDKQVVAYYHFKASPKVITNKNYNCFLFSR